MVNISTHVSNFAWELCSKTSRPFLCRISALSRSRPQRVLESAAENHGISVEELLEVPEGNRRRSMHDDITCVVFFLNGNRNNEGFTAVQGTKVQGVAVASGNSSPAQ